MYTCLMLNNHVLQRDSCVSLVAMSITWRFYENFSPKNYANGTIVGSVGIKGTYEILILGRALINYVTSVIVLCMMEC